ncbi:hypothetical protein, partial [Mycobacterium persicum]|uniref:hypothetical protein n=1 Tax=Mycobacterium persicum TaxID=1487726 RepID=UPI000A0B4CD8
SSSEDLDPYPGNDAPTTSTPSSAKSLISPAGVGVGVAFDCGSRGVASSRMVYESELIIGTGVS